MKKVLLIFGTRPEAIKLAPVIRALRSRADVFETRVCVTAQHRQMLDSVLALFNIVPDWDLAVMEPNQTLSALTAKCLTGLTTVLQQARPDIVLVQGDTTTTFAASLAAYYEKIQVGHIEAGLRTNNKFHPFPEEINRRLTTQVTDLHFAPTEIARRNLLTDGVPAERIFVTGNTVIDALLSVVEKQSAPDTAARWTAFFHSLGVTLDPERRILLVTGHRRESFGEGFENICQAIREIALANPTVDVLYPVHLNPNVQEPVNRILRGLPNVHLIQPIDYEPFVFLLSRAALILTDSGGVQEEGPSFGTPILVMRETTERPEGVDAGVVRLVGTNREKIVSETNTILRDPASWGATRGQNPYGDGHSAARIVSILAEHFGLPTQAEPQPESRAGSRS
jgi:UDP-N-acetylglucosamine 2-epimerase (non-hydrolysing)